MLGLPVCIVMSSQPRHECEAAHFVGSDNELRTALRVGTLRLSPQKRPLSTLSL